ncbi:FtsX-like permease family protein [Stakelama pacifica]|uniref:Putative ABC transport system permease protein n=1 Tax=Stakelama pacifica TaxID=517720 RepID=A0A4R6FKZ9_9SPHN|nr:ABC transporter permease [Stakelama pacifica]TDN82199.1 putative ABC transport system permease protein [Stakelama pacifica]GGO95992.1 cell division protein FtsX [Stakelama pacifica]
MIGTSLLTLYRSLTRHKLFAALNIGGLALGIAVFLVLFLFVQFERGYDRQLPGWDKIWLVNTSYAIPGFPAVNLTSDSGLLKNLKTDFADIDGVRLEEHQDTAVRNGRSLTTENVSAVDPGWFRLFPATAIEGDPIAVMNQPDMAVLTRSAAQRFFGSAPAIGQSLIMTIGGRERPFQIAALLDDLPKNMTYGSDIFIGLPPLEGGNGSDGSVRLFLRFPDASAATAFADKLPAFIDRHEESSLGQKPSDFKKLTLTPLAEVHLIQPKDRTVVLTLGLVGALTLLIAIINYVNLATARAGLRAREVALRKVLGATRRALILQLLVEAIAMAALSAILALALTELALPFVNTVGGTSLSIHYAGTGSILFPLALLIVGVGIVAGFYPAFILSRFNPARVLASVRTPGGGKAGVWLRKALVLGQFAIAIAFTIGTFVLIAQTRHVRHSDLGFDRSGLIIVPSFLADALDDAQRADLLRAFRNLPNVESAGMSRFLPTGGSFNASRYVDSATGTDISVTEVDVGRDFFTTYHSHLLAGRFFDDAHVSDDATGMDREALNKNPRNIILNRTALSQLGIRSPQAAIGQIAKFSSDTQPRIIGVVEDMRFTSPRDPVGAVVYHYVPRAAEGMVPTVRAKAGDTAATLAAMEAQWRSIAPAVPFRAKSVDDALYQRFYQQDAQRGRLFTIGAVLAVVIGCIGLYGLAAFDTSRRVREIGIRKALGASTRDILRLLIGQFLRPVLLANLIAWPLAYVAMRQWLSGFDDRVALSPAYFLIASLIALAIAVATVFAQSWRVARAEPAKALRYE